jgi:hypothetical protein
MFPIPYTVSANQPSERLSDGEAGAGGTGSIMREALPEKVSPGSGSNQHTASSIAGVAPC